MTSSITIAPPANLPREGEGDCGVQHRLRQLAGERVLLRGVKAADEPVRPDARQRLVPDARPRARAADPGPRAPPAALAAEAAGGARRRLLAPGDEPRAAPAADDPALNRLEVHSQSFLEVPFLKVPDPFRNTHLGSRGGSE